MYSYCFLIQSFFGFSLGSLQSVQHGFLKNNSWIYFPYLVSSCTTVCNHLTVHPDGTITTIAYYAGRSRPVFTLLKLAEDAPTSCFFRAATDAYSYAPFHKVSPKVITRGVFFQIHIQIY